MFDWQIASDLHKDAYGFRPSQGTWARWKAMSEAELTAEWDRLCRDLDAEVDRENAAFAAAEVAFEAHIAKLTADYGISRETAIRWDMDAMGIDAEDTQFYGMDWYGHHHGLRMNYFGAAQ